MKRHFALVLSTLLLLGGCAPRPSTPAPTGGMAAMNRAAEAYVRLVLALGQHDSDYVDAYYGPPEWRKEAEASKVPLPETRTRATTLLATLQDAAPAGADEMARLRHSYLPQWIGWSAMH